MKEKIMLLILITAVTKVYAIIFIPPVIYVVSFSLGAFITNLFIFLAFWLAVKGITDRSYLGKPVHELIKILIQIAGKTTVLIVSAILSVLVLNPITTKEIITASLSAGLLSLIIVYLNSFRKIRLIPEKEQKKALRSITLFTLSVILVTYISTTLALETRILYTEDGYRIGYEGRDAYTPFSPSLSKEPAGIMEDRVQYEETIETLWFHPTDSRTCRIYFEDATVLEAEPTRNCYYKIDNREERMNCPILLNTETIQKQEITRTGEVRGTGSCNESYTVTI